MTDPQLIINSTMDAAGGFKLLYPLPFHLSFTSLSHLFLWIWLYMPLFCSLLRLDISIINCQNPTEMPSRSALLYDLEGMSTRDEESGYASASSSEESIPDVFFTKPHLTFLNRQLQNLEPPGKMTSTSLEASLEN